MIKNVVVIVLFGDEFQRFLLPGDGTMNGVGQRGGGQLVAAQILLRAAEHRLGQIRLVLIRTEDQHRQPRRLHGEGGDLKQGRGIGLRRVEQQRVEIVGRHHRQPGVRRRLHGNLRRRHRGGHQFHDPAGEGFLAADQQKLVGHVVHIAVEKYNVRASLQVCCGTKVTIWLHFELAKWH